MWSALVISGALALGQPPALPSNPPPPVQAQSLPPVVFLYEGTAPAAQPTPEQSPPVQNVEVSLPGLAPPAPVAQQAPPATYPDRWPLMRLLQGSWYGAELEDRRIALYGWTEMSYNASTASRSNAPVFMIDKANQFLLNQNYLHFERTIDTSKHEVQWGWLMDWILPGSDARTSVVRGLWDDQLTKGPNGGPILYPIDPFQFYTQVFLPDLGGQGTTVKLGRFATHLEYELVQAPDTPFVSRSYLFEYNPFTHTGVWATTQLNDIWAVSNGVVLGNDNFIDPANRPTYIGQLKWSPKNGPTTVLFNVSLTDPRFDVAQAFNFYNVYNLQVIHKFSSQLTYVLDTAFSHEYGIPGIGSTTWYGAVNYLMYQHSATLTSTFRQELFEDTDGFRTGSKGLYQEYTYGLAWKPYKSLILRPSVRFDYNADSRPFEGEHGLFTAAMDVIVRW